MIVWTIVNVLILILLVLVIALIIKNISDNRVRRILVEKGAVDENVKYIFAVNSECCVPSSLKWGLVLLGIGLAIILGRLVPREYQHEITFGGMFLFAGIGFLAYYFIALRAEKKKEQKSEVSIQKTE